MENKHFKNVQDFLVKAKLLQKNSNCENEKKKKAHIVYLEDGVYNSSHETESLEYNHSWPQWEVDALWNRDNFHIDGRGFLKTQSGEITASFLSFFKVGRDICSREEYNIVESEIVPLFSTKFKVINK